MRYSLAVFLALFVQLINPDSVMAATDNAPAFAHTEEFSKASFSKNFGQLPMRFESNMGQSDEQVKFIARGQGYNLFLTDTEAVLSLYKKSDAQTPRVQQAAVRIKPVTDAQVRPPEGINALPGVSHYLLGNDSRMWLTDVPHYAKVKYAGIYPGIDLVYYGNQQQLEYDFVVSPGADPEAIRLVFEGVEAITIGVEGNLVLHTDTGDVQWRKPVIYQEIDGERKFIEGHYALIGKQQVGFALSSYDTNQPVVIDPVLVYSTYLGGSAGDDALGVAVDGSGNAYIAGSSYSLDFPTASPLQAGNGSSGGGYKDAFITKLSTNGSSLVYSTYLGGNGDDEARGIAVDTAGHAYVTGSTVAFNFPTQNPFQAGRGGGYLQADAFVSKLSAAGNSLIYSTYLGGGRAGFLSNDTGYDAGNAIAVDSSGSAYVTGITNSDDYIGTPFPVTPGSYDNGCGGCTNAYTQAFVTKFSPTGSSLVYSGRLGGVNSESGLGITVDAAGSAYVTGYTRSTDFPAVNQIHSYQGGGYDVFVTKYMPAGNALAYSTYLGGSTGSEMGRGIGVDGAGSAYVTGHTTSSNFPTTSGAYDTTCGTDGVCNGANIKDAFVSKLAPAGNSLVYSSYLGGSGNDDAASVAVSANGAAYVAGYTESTDFPVINPVQASRGGGVKEAFISKFEPVGNALNYSSYLGGGGDDSGAGVAVDNTGAAYVVGSTNSVDYPVVAPFQAAYRGGGDAFVTKMPAPVCTCN